MKILGDTALITDGEVMQVLEERGANESAETSKAHVVERLTWDFLNQIGRKKYAPAQLKVFVKACESDPTLQLTKSEIMQLINHVPRESVEIHAVLPRFENDDRVKAIAALVNQHLGD